jgi:ribonuclease HII
MVDLVAGLDEAGRGCLAGPVVAAAVILPTGHGIPGLADSKTMAPQRREELSLAVKERALAWSVGLSWPAEIERVNILQATLRAMVRALNSLDAEPGCVLVDGNQPLPVPGLAQECVVGGDARVDVISAASIMAKTWRDRLMRLFDTRYPGYGLAAHKGYGTREHLAALRRLGPCRLHRKTFRGVGQTMEQGCLPGLDADT